MNEIFSGKLIDSVFDHRRVATFEVDTNVLSFVRKCPIISHYALDYNDAFEILSEIETTTVTSL